MLTHIPASGYSQKLMTRLVPRDRQLNLQSGALAAHHPAKQCHHRPAIPCRPPRRPPHGHRSGAGRWYSFPPGAEVMNWQMMIAIRVDRPDAGP